LSFHSDSPTNFPSAIQSNSKNFTPPAPPPLSSDFATLFSAPKNSRAGGAKCENNLKSLNWTIIPENKLVGSLWKKKFDTENEADSPLSDIIDLDLLVKNFTQQINNKVRSDVDKFNFTKVSNI